MRKPWIWIEDAKPHQRLRYFDPDEPETERGEPFTLTSKPAPFGVASISFWAVSWPGQAPFAVVVLKGKRAEVLNALD